MFGWILKLYKPRGCYCICCCGADFHAYTSWSSPWTLCALCRDFSLPHLSLTRFNSSRIRFARMKSWVVTTTNPHWQGCRLWLFSVMASSPKKTKIPRHCIQIASTRLNPLMQKPNRCRDQSRPELRGGLMSIRASQNPPTSFVKNLSIWWISSVLYTASLIILGVSKNRGTPKMDGL